jgi:hypothetical protein
MVATWMMMMMMMMMTATSDDIENSRHTTSEISSTNLFLNQLCEGKQNEFLYVTPSTWKFGIAWREYLSNVFENRFDLN